MKAPITFAIAGFGDRGSTYASMQELFPGRMKVVAVADLNPDKVKKAKELYGIPEENCFQCAEEMLAKPRLADVAIISTMDRQHVGHALPALEQGYHVLMEKPISPDLQKCREILAAAAAHPHQHVILCHVLRYTKFYNTLKEIIDSGKIGDVVSICANENVGYWHQAHSFVRGNWRNSDETSPMILQKSCHDMDILTWLVGKKCKSVSSIGGIHLFKPECAPEGSTPYCLGGCKVKDNCIFDAEKIYITGEKTGLLHGGNWISSILSVENTVESTYAALKDGPYGRCVFHCDNNVVDHQQTNLLMEDGSTISFTMCAFTENCYRYFKAMGTKGEIEADMKSNTIRLRVFGQGEEVLDLNTTKDLKGHGGGDSGIIADFLDMLIDGAPPTERTTTLESSMESHYIALAAEESRLNGGERIDLDAFRARHS
ncbi:gfo/Idh/MocA family oxidoreductase [Acutalibacter sp. 1XD8-33]|uniref:Gfo/Idh/MocA family protein n=1 Tax=Acutalibacter sp. 1XD8-33 TaxID=2320081 RepID=UPI000EA1BFE3|nr:Gfo/Idh/MocA family oxidoreductase [Acutalibacter sp. 1XD8-33]RKJ39423.1 gfo/Idh/MocA family oxidoreductase [Acutalibacter sp. 1XD8-33]